MLTRRRFLAQSTKSVLAFGAGHLLIGRSVGAAEAESSGRHRIGILGAANSGRSMLAAALAHVAAERFPSPRYPYRDFAEPPLLTRDPVPIRAMDALVVTERGNRLADFASPRMVRWNLLTDFLPFDTAILVIAANEGPNPETRDQLRLARTAGVDRVAVFISKTDLLDNPELLELVELEARDLLDAVGYDSRNVPIIATSAREAIQRDRSERHRIQRLLTDLDGFPRSRPAGRLPLLYRIAHVERGTDRSLVTGFLEQGTLVPGQSADIRFFGRNGRGWVHEVLREAQVPTTEPLRCVVSGPRALLDRGAALVGPDGPGDALGFAADLYLLGEEQLAMPRSFPIFSGYRPSIAVTENQPATLASVRIADNETKIERGTFGAVQVDLSEPLVLRRNEVFRFVEGGQAVAIGRLRRPL